MRSKKACFMLGKNPFSVRFELNNCSGTFSLKMSKEFKKKPYQLFRTSFSIRSTLISTLFDIGWRTSFGSFSNWLASGTGENANAPPGDTDDKNRENVGNTIPKLPVPDLRHTLTRYLHTLQPILDERMYNHTKCLVDEFGRENGIGEKLQEKLLKRRELYDNWAYDWWLDDMYLNNQLALPINSNPGMVWPPQNFKGVIDIAKFAAKIVRESISYKRLLDGNGLQQETVGSGDQQQPLCMAQYYRIFTSYRVPGVLKDTLLKSETDFTKARPHIVVACRNQFYVLHLTKGDDAELLTEDEIASHMMRILEEKVTILKRRLPVGILTTLKRDKWGEIRELLIKDETNRRSISLIEKCMLIVCFDLEDVDGCFNKTIIDEKGASDDAHKTPARDETSMAHQMLHGCGSFANSGNRWFDKTIQIIVGKDGVNGLCYEHSPAEGVAVINAMQVILDGISDKFPNIQIDSNLYANSLSAIETLNWNLTDTLQRQVYSAKEQFDECVKNLDFNVFRYKGYGKEFIKSCRCSPDAYIQLALQYTYYRLNRKLCATYESASTRRFRLGRVDCIRANTIETLNWVSAMLDDRRQFSASIDEISIEKKLSLFDEAMRQQIEITAENINGHGIDVHLLGLRQTAKNEQQQQTENIFSDKAYMMANHFSLSTSQVATKENSFMGYGPVVPNGYGASYNPKEDSIIFCISSFKSDPATSTENFVRTLHASLNSMRDLLQQRNRAI